MEAAEKVARLQGGQRLGETCVTYAVHSTKTRQADGLPDMLEYQPLFTLQNFTTTKLNLTLIWGYPMKPSRGDIQDIKSYGYTGISDIADRALRLNVMLANPTVQRYPVPLSAGAYGNGLRSGGFTAVRGFDMAARRHMQGR